DPEFEAYDPDDEVQRRRLAKALGAEKKGADSSTTLLTLRPFPFQEEILDKLVAERVIHGSRRNLVVAATGTGKTAIGAFDYARACGPSGTRARVLFLAHRREILVQARDTFRHVVQDRAFGELLTSTDALERGDHVFATIQSAAGLIERFGPAHWRHV